MITAFFFFATIGLFAAIAVLTAESVTRTRSFA